MITTLLAVAGAAALAWAPPPDGYYQMSEEDVIQICRDTVGPGVDDGRAVSRMTADQVGVMLDGRWLARLRQYRASPDALPTVRTLCRLYINGVTDTANYAADLLETESAWEPVEVAPAQLARRRAPPAWPPRRVRP